MRGPEKLSAGPVEGQHVQRLPKGESSACTLLSSSVLLIPLARTADSAQRPDKHAGYMPDDRETQGTASVGWEPVLCLKRSFTMKASVICGDNFSPLCVMGSTVSALILLLMR
jgi:hypothetical protein